MPYAIRATAPLLCLAAGASAQPVINGTGIGAPATSTQLFGVTPSGWRGVGESGFGSGPRAAVWARNTGLLNLGVLPGFELGSSIALAISNDGMTVVGYSQL